MTSPNVVEIRVVAKDQTAPGFNAAAAGAGKLAKSVDGGPASAGAALESAEKKARGLGSVLGNVGTIAGGILAADFIREGAQKIMALSQSTIKAASALGESINAVEKTFGSASAQIKAFGETSSQTAGLSNRAFNQMAVPLGAMLKNAGLSMAEVSEQTIKLTKRAADMGSVFDTDVSQVLAAIQAGLRGEADPLERFGVGLSAAAVEARALADSGKESTMALTAQEKAMARLNVIYEQTASTEGDFTDTADSLANAQRRATGSFEDAQAKIGAMFLPVMAKAADVSGRLAESIGSIPGPVAAAGAAVLIAGAGLLVFAPRVMATKQALDEMALSESAVTRGAGRLATAVGKGAVVFAGLQIATAALGAAIGDDVTPQVDGLAKSLIDLSKQQAASGEITRLFGDDLGQLDKDFHALGSGAKDKAARGISDFFNSIADFDSLSGGSLTNMRARIEGVDAALAQLVGRGRGEEAAAAFEFLAKRAAAAGISIDDLKSGLPQYAAAMAAAGKSTTGVAAAAEEATKSLDELEKQFDETFKKTFGFEEAQDAAADAVARLNKQIEQQIEDEVEGAGTLDRNTQAGRDNAESVRDLVRKYEELMVQAQKTGQSTDGLREQLVDQLVAMGFSRAEADRYVKTLIDLKTALDQIQSKTVTVRMNVEQNKTWGGGAQEFAHGGIRGAAAAGGPRGNRTLVGEHGPELVDLAPGSMVHSNPDSMAMMSGGGGRLELMISLDPSIAGRDRDLVESLCKMLRYKVRIDGSEVIGIPST